MKSNGATPQAAIVGYVELPAARLDQRLPFEGTLEMCAHLAAAACSDAGIPRDVIDGLISGPIFESRNFVPSTLAEYLGLPISFGEYVDLGGASAAGMIWRAAAAIQAGMARAVLCLAPGLFDATAMADWARFGASSYLPGSPQAEFEIPIGFIGQNAPYALIASAYGSRHGYDEVAMARLVAQQRANANGTPGAIFEHASLDTDEVLASRMIADPLRMLEIVMPCAGGAAVLVVDRDLAKDRRWRPVWLTGAGEALGAKSIQYSPDPLASPVGAAAARAFSAAGRTPAEMDAVQIYDCYSITVLLTLENAGFCGPGEGKRLLRERDLTWGGDFPVNTNGGQLGYGQTGLAGGMGHVVEAARQIMGRAAGHQVNDCDRVFVTGNGGIMSENVALVLEGK